MAKASEFPSLEPKVQEKECGKDLKGGVHVCEQKGGQEIGKE